MRKRVAAALDLDKPAHLELESRWVCTAVPQENFKDYLIHMD